MAEILEVEIIAKLDKIQAGLDQIDKKAQGAGKNAGSSFGNAFVSVASSILATISFNAVLGGINSAVGAYRNLNTVQTSLQTSIAGINRNTEANTAILKDNNSTLEQKARALGLNIENYEKTAKATGGASNASKSYKVDLKNEEDALKSKEDANKKEVDGIKKSIDVKKESIDSIEKNIESIEKEKDAKLENAGATDKIIKAENDRIRQAEAQLDKEAKAINQKYEAQFGSRAIGIKQELFAQQTIMNGIKTQERALNDNAVANKTQLEALSKQKDAVNNKIDALRQEQEQININRDTELAQLELKQLANKQQLESDKEKLNSVRSTNESIKASYTDQVNEQKDQIQSVKDDIALLQKDIESKQAKFDIDTEPAKKKIEDLKSQIQNISLASSGGGAVAGAKVVDREKLRKDVDAGVIKQGNTKQISGKDVGDKVKAMYEKFQGTVSEATISSAFTNVFQGGIKDADQANKLIEQYVDSAANGKSASISLDQAVNNLSETFKTGSSTLGNLSGITQNYSIIDREGLEIMKARGEANAKTVDDLTEKERAIARLEGTMKTENIAQGTFNKLAASGAFEQDKFNAELLKTQQAIGKDLTPAFNEALKALTPIIKGFTDFVAQNPQVVTAIAGLALGLTAFLSVATGISAVISVFGTFGAMFAAGGALAGVGAFFATTATVIAGVTVTIGGLIASITLVLAAIAGFALAYQNNWFGVRDITNNVLDNIKEFFKGFIDGALNLLSKGWENTVEGIKNILGGFVIALSILFFALTNPVEFFYKGVLPLLSKAWENTIKFFNDSGTKFTEFFTTLWSNVTTGISQFILDGPKKLEEGFKNTFDSIKSFAETMMTSIIQGFTNGINFIIQKFNSFFDALPSEVGVGDLKIQVFKPRVNELPPASPFKFADGGVVPGSSYFGDKVPVLANSGEMILNNAQQNGIIKLLGTLGSLGSQSNNSKQVTINQNNNIQGQVGLQSANSQLAFLLTNNL